MGLNAINAIQAEISYEIATKYEGDPGAWTEAQGVNYDALVRWCRSDMERVEASGRAMTHGAAMSIGFQLGLRMGAILGQASPVEGSPSD
jgi:hypothetical protein